jgi:DNA-binding MarR family transcriptional regulator
MPRAHATRSPSRPAPPAEGALAAWPRYRDNLPRHLIGVARDLQLRLMSHLVSSCDHRDLRPSFGLLIALVSQSPRPLTQLAQKLAISPQAASQLVGLAERAGYVARRGDPSDRRTRLAVLTPAGERLVRDGIAGLQAIEAEHRRCVGAPDYRRFSRALGALVQGLDLIPQPGGSTAATNRAPAQASAGWLPILAAHVEQALMRATAGRGHPGLKLSHGQILTLIGPSGARLHRLAELHRVSRQAISATAQDLEAQGYLRREGDPNDRRGVVVRLTGRGRALIEDSVGALDELERDWKKRIDEPTFEAFERVARQLYGALELETSILSDAFGTVARSDARPRELAGDGAEAIDDLERLAARIRDRLGTRDAARLAAHLVTDS